MPLAFAGRPAYMEVDLSAVRHNVQVIRNLTGANTLLMAMVKGDAYGHGAVAVSQAALAAGASRLAVATIEEGIALRQAGINAPILMLGWAAPEQLELALSHNLSFAIFDYENAALLSQAARKLARPAVVHLKVDSGMARLGLRADPPDVATLQKIIRLPNLEFEGIFSHFAKADAHEQSYTKEQLRRFFNFLDAAAAQGLNPPLRHIANGSAIFDFPPSHLDMVRTGILLYGCWPSAYAKGKMNLRPVMRVVAKISQIHDLKVGDYVGYGCTWQAQVPSRVATLPLGYADGLPRLLANKAEVLIGGQRARLIGSICMDQVMVDVTHIAQAKAGDEAVIVGRQDNQQVTLEELAAHAQTINYEIMTRLGQRLPRIYVHQDL